MTKMDKEEMKEHCDELDGEIKEMEDEDEVLCVLPEEEVAIDQRGQVQGVDV